MTPALLPVDWSAACASLDARGCAVVGPVFGPEVCAGLAGLYDRAEGFRSRVVMARHGFGQGEYRYFDYPLPGPVQTLREAAYAALAPIANGWASRMGQPADFPSTLEAQVARCHAAGQVRATPLLLRYGPGDYNCLHQDLYGPVHFPLQMTVLLSEPERDFEGGEFVLVEQRPRMQSRAEVVALRQGEAVVFAVKQRPVGGSRGDYRVTMRHGVSRVRAGLRHTLGIIFHDAA
jgi:hypothetical protein